MPEMYEKHLLKLRRNIVSLRERYKECDSISKRSIMESTLDNMEETLCVCCPHKLVVIDYSQSFNYEENYKEPSRMHCVVCGTRECGLNTGITKNYEWNPGTYKVLVNEPFARFELGTPYSVDALGYSQGRWGMDEDLNHDLDQLVDWVKKYGYKVTTAADLKKYDENRAEREKEERYQHFKKENYARLKKEFSK